MAQWQWLALLDDIQGSTEVVACAVFEATCYQLNLCAPWLLRNFRFCRLDAVESATSEMGATGDLE